MIFIDVVNTEDEDDSWFPCIFSQAHVFDYRLNEHLGHFPVVRRDVYNAKDYENYDLASNEKMIVVGYTVRIRDRNSETTFCRLGNERMSKANGNEARARFGALPKSAVVTRRLLSFTT